MKASLSKGEAIKVTGPANVSIEKGCTLVNGVEICEGKNVIVHRVRSYVFYAVRDSLLDIVLGESASVEKISGDDPFPERYAAAESILSTSPRKIVVIGGTDAGKTSFTTILANTSLSKGLRPAVVDGDMGQANIGPPGFVSLGFPDRFVYWNTEIPPFKMRFVGDIKPHGATGLVIAYISELVEDAIRKSALPVIVDTDGWISDARAVEYKYHLIDALRPDVVVAIGEELRGVFKQFEKEGISVYELRSPRAHRTRNREERRLMRSMRYRDFLVNAPLLKISMEKVLITGLPLFHGVELERGVVNSLGEGAVYACKLFDTLYIYGDLKRVNTARIAELGLTKYKVYPAGFEKGLYVALSDNSGDYPAILEKFDFANRLVLVRSLYRGTPLAIKLSRIKLKEDFSEERVEV